MNDAGQVNKDRGTAKVECQRPRNQTNQVWELMGAQEELLLSFTETQRNASTNSYFEKYLRSEALIINRLCYTLNSSPII